MVSRSSPHLPFALTFPSEGGTFLPFSQLRWFVGCGGWRQGPLEISRPTTTSGSTNTVTTRSETPQSSRPEIAIDFAFFVLHRVHVSTMDRNRETFFNYVQSFLHISHHQLNCIPMKSPSTPMKSMMFLSFGDFFVIAILVKLTGRRNFSRSKTGRETIQLGSAWFTSKKPWHAWFNGGFTHLWDLLEGVRY